MKKSFKKIVALLLTVILLSITAASPFTAFASGVTPRWQYISLVTFNIYFQGTEGSACGTADFYDNSLYARGKITVYESDGDGGWTRIATMVEDTLDLSIGMVCFFEATPYVEYYAEFELTVHGRYSTETETFTDQETCPTTSG